MKSFNVKHIVMNISLMTISLIVSIALAEMVMRHFYPVDVGTSFKYRIPHQEYGWVLKPDASYINQMPEGSVRVTYNSTGFHDIEHSINNNRNLYRILVLGDSYMEGYNVKLEDMFHKRIEGFARNNEVDVETINLGVGGYGTLQEYLVFQGIGKYYKPKIVLLGFYIGNDIKNNSLYLEAGYGPAINMKSKKSVSRPFLVPSNNETSWEITQIDFEGVWQRYEKAMSRKPSLVWRLKQHSALLNALWLAKSSGWSFSQVDKHTKDGKKMRNYGRYCKEHKDVSDAWLTTKRILGRLNNEVTNIGAKLIVFTVPAQKEVLKEEFKNDQNRELIRCEYDKLKRIFVDLDIGHIDLLPSFRKVSNKGKQNLFRRSDRHWNEAGHNLAAKIVFSTLKDRGLLLNAETTISPNK